MINKMLAASLILFSSCSLSAEQITKITKLVTYGTYGTSDTRYRNQIDIEVETPAAGCDGGFYVSSDDVENSSTLSGFLLSAFHSDVAVRFAADENQVLPGSKKYCRVLNISLIK